MSIFKRFCEDRSGATAIEYGLIAACLSLVIVAGVGTVANGVEKLFSDPAGKIQTSIK
ncbi:MAG: Flp family type IVb pilin [Mesorhizobium sp.]